MLIARKVLLSAALVLGSALAASAADLGGTSLKDAPVMEAMPAASPGWYIRADGGYNWFTTPGFSAADLTTYDSSMDGSWSVGGGIGRYFGRGFRGDITVDYLFGAKTNTSFLCGCAEVGSTQFDVSSTVVLANLYYDFNRGGRFNPYIGAGVGFARNETSSATLEDPCGCTSSYGGKSTNNFAAAAMAGISWRIRGGQTTYIGGMKDEPVAISSGNALYLDFGYRFLYLGEAQTAAVYVPMADETVTTKAKDLTAHQLRVGLRYDLN